MADIVKVPYPSHPDRCQSMQGNNQCPNLALPGIRYCQVHGSRAMANHNRQEVKNYKIALLRMDMEDKLSSDGVISLREELALTRILLEKRLNMCQTASDLIRESTPILQQLALIERLVTACHKLETSLGQMLSKSSIIQFCSTVINIINNHIEDKDVLNVIALELLAALDGLKAVNGEEAS
jgi:hypothetical protein